MQPSRARVAERKKRGQKIGSQRGAVSRVWVDVRVARGDCLAERIIRPGGVDSAGPLWTVAAEVRLVHSKRSWRLWPYP